MQFEESIQVFGLGGYNTLWDMHDSDSDSEPSLHSRHRRISLHPKEKGQPEKRLCPQADESRLLFKKILTFIINSCLRSSKLISCRLHFPITRQIQDKKECLVCWADGRNSPIQNI